MNKSEKHIEEDIVLELAGDAKLKYVKLELVYIKSGTFMMGSPKDELGRCDDEVQHEVTLTKDYWLGKYEVTKAQYRAVMGKTTSFWSHDDDPVVLVEWYQAKEFCEKLTAIEKATGRLLEGYEYTLPTEAQWEYACRAGTTTALNSGKNLSGRECSEMDEVGWYRYNSDNTIHSVGEKKPNAWRLYDMHGNVYEWCLDWYGDYPTSAVTDPLGPGNGEKRIVRGGSSNFSANCCRSADRYYCYPRAFKGNLGFRVALSSIGVF